MGLPCVFFFFLFTVDVINIKKGNCGWYSSAYFEQTPLLVVFSFSSSLFYCFVCFFPVHLSCGPPSLGSSLRAFCIQQWCPWRWSPGWLANSMAQPVLFFVVVILFVLFQFHSLCMGMHSRMCAVPVQLPIRYHGGHMILLPVSGGFGLAIDDSSILLVLCFTFCLANVLCCCLSSDTMWGCLSSLILQLTLVIFFSFCVVTPKRKKNRMACHQGNLKPNN